MSEPMRALPSPEWSGFRDFLDGETRRDPRLATPVRVLWRAYLVHCRTWGFPASDATDFVLWLREEEGLRVREGGSGRVRRMVDGLCLSC